MTNEQVPNMIQEGLATGNQGSAVPYLQSAISGSRIDLSNPNLQITPAQFNVFEPSTGRSALVDASGRRVKARKDMTGIQLTRINSMRQQLGLAYLKEHNVSSMSIDSASLLIDDYMYFVAVMQKYADNNKKLREVIDILYREYPQNTKAIIDRVMPPTAELNGME